MITAGLVVLAALTLVSLRNRAVRNALAISIVTILITILAYKITDTRFFSFYVYPESFALKDFEFSDLAFARRENPELDDRIVLVNIGNLGRREIAIQIQNLTQCEPKVIAFDGYFNCAEGLRDSINCPALLDKTGNQMLSAAIRAAGNVILATKLLQADSLSRSNIDLYDSLETSDPEFSDFSKAGFTSLPTNATHQEDVKLSRTFFPRRMINLKEELSFGVQIAMQFDSAKALNFLARNNDEEVINYRGNIYVQLLGASSLGSDPKATDFNTMFYVVDAEEVLRGEVLPELVKDHIVIMGYLGDYLGDPAWEDKFFTPLNRIVAGRANPDMFGSVIHANVVAMILNEDYIDELTLVEEFIVGFLASILHISLLLIILRKWHVWYDLAAIGLVIVQLAFFSWVRYQLLILFNIKAQLTVGIASLAIASIMVVVYTELFPHLVLRFKKRKVKVN